MLLYEWAVNVIINWQTKTIRTIFSVAFTTTTTAATVATTTTNLLAIKVVLFLFI